MKKYTNQTKTNVNQNSNYTIPIINANQDTKYTMIDLRRLIAKHFFVVNLCTFLAMLVALQLTPVSDWVGGS